MKNGNYYTYKTEWYPEDNCYIARVLEFPSLSAFGETRSEAEAELDTVIEDVLKWMAEKKDKIILKPIRKVREGWDEAFKKMKIASDDKLIIDDSLNLLK
ncbi:MAG: type II toxin-antitoxin system HicB family antitoxin [Spirochaetota bacterium]